MIEKPNQNCEFGCETNDCKHVRSDALNHVIMNRHQFELDSESESFLKLDSWVSESLENLEQQYSSFTTIASARRFHQR